MTLKYVLAIVVFLLAPVAFSCVNFFGDLKDWPGGGFTATLIDNSDTVCTYGPGPLFTRGRDSTITDLNCAYSGFGAYIDTASNNVQYTNPGGIFSFPTTFSYKDYGNDTSETTWSACMYGCPSLTNPCY